MDPISIIVAALAAGAAAGVKPAAEQAIKDAYQGIKGLIKRKYARVNIEVLEGGPASDARKAVVREDLEQTGAGQDEEVLRQAQVVLEAIRKYAPEAARAVGVTIEKVEAGAISISDVHAEGAGVIIRDGKIQGPIDVRGVRAGDGGSKA
jgi:hypothetical protein